MTKSREKILKDKVSMLPSDPGVYQFINSEGVIIYVGKAKNLKKRVSSYFITPETKTRKLRVLVKNIVDIRHIVVATESDALLLENNLIKELKPRYNILLKDDKTYPWIAIRNEDFPRVVSTRILDRDGSRYFGPYASGYIQKMLIELVRSVYSIRTCGLKLTPQNIANNKFGVCLEYHIGNCKGPCVAKQNSEEYSKNIAMVEDILRGNLRAVINHLTTQMNEAAAQLRFEQAQLIKSKLDQLDNFQAKSVIVSPTLTNLDAFFPMIDKDVAYCNFIRVANGSIISSFTIEMKLGVDESPEDVLTFAISRIAEQIEGPLSREVLVPFMPEVEMFTGIKFVVPQRGDKLKLLEFAEKNCKMYRLEQLKYIEKTDPARHINRIMEQMKNDLYLSVHPTHIECFDNSNIQGNYPVAACVVFRDGRPSRREYRHFNIKTVVGANDFASMEEVIGRRYRRLLDEGGDLPQLIVVDGGKGQLSMAYGVLKELGLENRIAIIGLAKRLEEVFYPNDNVPHYLDKSSETLKILMHIRDEAHRFGITFHRNKRSADFIKNELEQIPGVGERSVEKLLKKYKTVARVRKATAEELTALISKRSATALIAYLEANP